MEYQDPNNCCDYTIDCGVRVTECSSTTVESAIKKFKENRDPYDADTGLTRAVVYTIAERQDIDIEEWNQEYVEAQAKENLVIETEVEKREYERLKAKYG